MRCLGGGDRGKFNFLFLLKEVELAQPHSQYYAITTVQEAVYSGGHISYFRCIIYDKIQFSFH